MDHESDSLQAASQRRMIEVWSSWPRSSFVLSPNHLVTVTDAEAQQYFEDNRLKFGDLPGENFKENIKVFLTREQVNQRLGAWFEVLRSNTRFEFYRWGRVSPNHLELRSMDKNHLDEVFELLRGIYQQASSGADGVEELGTGLFCCRAGNRSKCRRF